MRSCHLQQCWIGLESIMLSKVRERQIPCDDTYNWNQKKQKKTNQNSFTENRLMASKGKGIGDGKKG